MLAHGVVRWSSRIIGLSCYLAPLAHMTAVMIGEGQEIVGGKLASTRCPAAHLAPIALGPKEGLA